MVVPIRHRSNTSAGLRSEPPPGRAPARVAAVGVGVKTPQVFADGSGRRWRRLRSAIAVGVVASIVGLGLLGSQVYAVPVPVARVGVEVSDADLEAIGAEVTARPLVVGVGPLVRAVRLERDGPTVRIADTTTGAPLGDLGRDDAARVRGHRYVVQRYGYAPGLRRTISLTFDDGPDPRYTPRLLDLLSREHAPATFFGVGEAMVKYPDLVRREAREGHLVAGHSMTHPDLSTVPAWRAHAELVGADRTIRALAGRHSPLIRLPYEGDGEQETVEAVVGALRAQSLGYVVASHDVDSLDWYHAAIGSRVESMALPQFDGENLPVLMHDGGGRRDLTLAYAAKLIAAAKAAGYTFTTMAVSQEGVLPGSGADSGPGSGSVPVTRADRLAAFTASVLLAWPERVLDVLFLAALGTVGVNTLFAGLSLIRAARRRHTGFPPPERCGIRTAVVLAAFNEETVIRRTLEHILASDYPLTEIVVVDDGSSDRTAAIVDAMTLEHPRLRLIRQLNTGKARALNRGILSVDADVVATMDADTVLQPQTVGRLVRHFAVDPDGRLGAVAGVVRVGNRSCNLLTRWQAMEYLTQIGVERSAHDVLGAIAIVPGACAAWRREAVLAAGGYSPDTLAEDCDLTLGLHRTGWRVTQDDEALAFTEAPEDVDGLLAQRTRWSYGTMQAVFKHRDLLLRPRYGWLGMLVLPTYVLSILMPLVFLPLTTVMAYLLVSTDGWGALGEYAAVFTGAQVVVTSVAVLVMRESPRHLLMVPIYRVIFEPLRAYLVYTSAGKAVKGIRAGWNKLERSGRLDSAVGLDSAVAGPEEEPEDVVLPPDAPPTLTIDLRRSGERRGPRRDRVGGLR